MSARRPYLSKSRIISAWQCPKKLFLEKHRPELAEISTHTEALFATGRQVGRIAQACYGSPDSVEIPFNQNINTMLRETAALVTSGSDSPIFEATFRHANVLVRVDILVPDGEGWRAIEVKASTSVKDYHVLDCAIQYWVMRRDGIPVTSISLAHVDNRFVYDGDDRYDGLFVEVDLTSEVHKIEPTIETIVEQARDAVTGSMPEVRVGAQCNKPYECQFTSFCWPTDAEYPITGLGGSKAKLGDYVARGHTDIRDVEAADITAETQRRIHRVTRSGKAEILDGAGQALAALSYPRYYLDFETIAPAVPFWKGTRPYEAVPVQWSCHIDDGRGDGTHRLMRHEEFLDLSGKPPMRRLAHALVECIGDTGPVLTYTSYEEQVLRGLIRHCAELEHPLLRIVDRLFDLYPIVKANYYHPEMLGSWSIKAVLPTVSPLMDYARLEGISEGTAASDGFLEAISPATTPQRKAELEKQLLRYCRFDTEAMVELVRFFSSTYA